MLSVLVRFSRPHTIIATTVQVAALFLIVGGGEIWSSESLRVVLLTLVSCLALNLYIVGLNQITDVAIDRINKPRLPLASNELSMEAGRLLVAVMGAVALAGAWLAGPLLLATVLAILLIGTAYSVPPLRLKRRSLWAALSIALARGVIANVGVGLHYNQVFGGLAGFSPFTLAVLGAFFFAFGIVIAIYKDIPDLMGDQMHGIQTLTVRLGPRGAFQAGRLILTVGYAGLMLVAVSRLPRPEAWWMLAAQLGLLAAFWLVSSRVDPAQQASFARFYLFLWGLFYAQYVVMSFYQLGSAVG
jgi:homogentisate phytyltransferase / homogentisate geranylgeranyltransferase